MSLRRSMRRAALTGFGLLPRPVRRRGVRLGTPSFTVGGVLVVTDAADRVLLLRQRHHRDGLTLPGGLLRRGEDPADALRREVAEEVGIFTDVQRPAAVVVDPARRRVDLIFAAHFAGDPAAVRPDAQEVVEVCWRTSAEFDGVSPATVQVLAELARARLGSVGSARPASQ